MKAGLTIHVQKLELIGGAGDTVPRRLFTKDGVMVDVQKYYAVQTKKKMLYDQRGNQFIVVDGGWVTPAQAEQNPESNGK